jgi:hypothetical protein
MHLSIDTIILAAIISSLIGPAIVKILDYILFKWKKRNAEQQKKSAKDPLEEAIQNSEVINAYLHNLITEFGFDRSWVSMFHNGGHYYPTGKSIQKFSIFYEVCGPGIATIQNQFMNIPVSLFSKSISEVYKHGKLIASIDGDNKYDLESAMIATGSLTTYLFALKNLEGKFFGIIGFDLIKDVEEISQEDLLLLQTQINTLSGYIFEYLHIKQ